MIFFDYESVLSRRYSWSIGALLALVAAFGYLYWNSRPVPMYAAVTTLQFGKLAPGAKGNDAASAFHPEDIKTFRRILKSDRLRTQVAESFTPAERSVVLRPALRRLVSGQPAPAIRTAMGSIEPEAVGASALIRVKVTHEDPEAAALIANRYVEQFRKLLVQDQSRMGSASPRVVYPAVPFRRLDVARANFAPRSPDLTGIKRGGIGVFLLVWAIATVVLTLAAAFRYPGEMSSA